MTYYWKTLSYDERLKIYNDAKAEYYNGIEKMSDIEFDELEESLDLDNKGYVGTVSSVYTIPHPIVMGSLSKVQIKEKDGVINWDKHLTEVNAYLSRSSADLYIETPKYDGCSFEVVLHKSSIVSIATRGSHDKGKDIKPFLEPIVTKAINWDSKCLAVVDNWCIRGEILVRKDVFKEKYSQFTNPRSWVSGLINKKYNPDDNELLAQIADLDIVIYNIKGNLHNDPSEAPYWVDFNWVNGKLNDIPLDIVNRHFLPTKFELIHKKLFSVEEFKKHYDMFSRYRTEECMYALDGFVLNPYKDMQKSSTEDRPKDSVAIKFLPFLQPTTVRAIEWSLGKTGELFPVIVTDPVMLDNRGVTRASASNYGKLLENKINVGAKVILSLAGDIIPYIFKVVEPSENTDYLNGMTDITIDGCHLYKNLNPTEVARNCFIASCKTLEIRGLGDAAAEKLFDAKNDHNLSHIFLYPQNDIMTVLGGKTGENVLAAVKYAMNNSTLDKIILSCSFGSCGKKTSEECAKYLVNGTANFKGLDEDAYLWVKNEFSCENIYLSAVLTSANKSLQSFEINKVDEDTIPIIMTGSPTSYATKKEFLNNNPQYRETSSWSECKILFTGDLTSTSSKMNKAKKLGITISVY